MPSVAELLKAANIAEDVIQGLPKEVSSAIESHLAEADNKFKTAAQKEAEAAEAFRLAGLEKKEITDYVEKYGTSLTELANTQAENKALRTYLESLKTQGFQVEIPAGAKPAVPGSPAVGGNAVQFDETKLRNELGSTLATTFKINNEYQRLFGKPIPDDIEAIVDEAKRNKMGVMEYAEKKYGFAAKRDEITKAERQKEIDAAVNAAREEERKKFAERNGNNPNLRTGQSSSNSLIPAGKPEEFHKADVNMPRNQRLRRMLDNIHKDLEAANGAA